MLKVFKYLFILIVSIYIIICIALYFFQEKLIFVPQKLPADFAFSFEKAHEEIFVALKDGNHLNGILFRADSSKGLVFYLHGNAGALNSWGNAADTYLSMHYDFFVMDYRGYGKSEGEISSEQQVHEDIQAAYNLMLKKYNEDEIIIAGYSIGTGPAAYLASINKPKMLILQAPYYNLTELALSQYPFIPSFLLRYKFETSSLLPNVKSPVVIFHGDQDNLITIDHAYKLKKLFKPGDQLIVLDSLGHNGMNDNLLYKQKLGSILSYLK